MTAAMILCAGFGTRLLPLTRAYPKPLLTIGDRPAFKHIVDQLLTAFDPIVINLHHGAEQLKQSVYPPVLCEYEPTILGTAGGVRGAAQKLGKGAVLVWNGDIHARVQLDRLIEHHHTNEHRGAVATLLVQRKTPHTGPVGLADNGTVTRLRNEVYGKEVHGAAYVGVMVLSAAARERLPEQGCLIGDLLMPMLRENACVCTFEHEGPWIDIGTPTMLLQANMTWLANQQRTSYCAPCASVSNGAVLDRVVLAGNGKVNGKGLVSRCLVLPGAELTAPATAVIAMAGGIEVKVEPSAATLMLR